VYQVQKLDHHPSEVKFDEYALLAYTVIYSFIFIAVMQVLLNFGINEVIKAWNLRDIMQQQIVNILDNLEEAIITKNNTRISLCNEQGNKILWNISQHLKLGQNNYCQEEEERHILKAKIFKLFEDENAQALSKVGTDVQPVNEFRSLNQIFKMRPEDLNHKIFTINMIDF